MSLFKFSVYSFHTFSDRVGENKFWSDFLSVCLHSWAAASFPLGYVRASRTWVNNRKKQETEQIEEQ